MEKELVKGMIAAIGLGCLVTAQILIYLTFMGAYYTPEKEILVTVNEYGEAEIEYWLMLLVTFIMTPFTIYYYMYYMVRPR